MNNELFLDRLELQNFRCYETPEIGPFRKFNLIYGRNGSGKTSLIEALEIALSGQSSRIETHRRIQPVVARNKAFPVKLGVFKNTTLVSGFDSSRSRAFEPKNVLFRLFGIQASGQRARNLLPDLLQTHNLLYAERIIQFLEADRRDTLNRVLNESLLGRATMDQWSRIEAARLSISALLNERREEREQVNTSIKELDQQLSKLGTKEDSDVQARWIDIGVSFPVVTKLLAEHSGTLFSRGPTVDALANIATAIRETKALCDQLYAGISSYENGTCTSLTNTYQEEKRVRGVIIDVRRQVNDREKQISELQKNLTEMQGRRGEARTKIQEKREHAEKLWMLEKTLGAVINWFPEIMADHSAATIEGEIAKLKDRLQRLETAIDHQRLLPTVELLRDDIKQQQFAIKSLSELQSKAAGLQQIHDAEEQELTEAISQLRQHQTHVDMARRTILELHAKLDDYLGFAPTSHCPSCGTEFESPHALRAAIAIARKATEKLQAVSAVEEITKRKIRAEQVLATIEVQRRDIDGEIAEAHSKIDSYDRIVALYQELINGCQVALEQAGFDVPQYGDLLARVDKLACEPLQETAEIARKRLVELTKNVSGLWEGLRRDKYQLQRYELEEDLIMIPDLCDQLDTPAPKPREVASFLSALERVSETILQAKESIVDLEGFVKEAGSAVERQNRDIEVHKLSLERLERQLRTLNLALERVTLWKTHYERLTQIGIVGNGETLDPGSVDLQLTGALSAVENLRQELVGRTENDKLKTHLQEELRQFTHKGSRLDNVISKLTVFSEEIGRVQSPQDYYKQMLKGLEKTIGTFFENLHWPRDFDDVRFSYEGDDFELTVCDAIAGKRYPAHDRLSAGQRAALAISVFWALNSTLQTAPAFLLMDEPIQNVDELNVLNFLDGLRWFIETTKHQIFLTTSSQRIEALARKKFAYLKDDFLEVALRRDYGCTRLEYIGWNDENISVTAGSASMAR